MERALDKQMDTLGVSQPKRTQIFYECLVVLSLCFLPSMIVSARDFWLGEQPHLSIMSYGRLVALPSHVAHIGWIAAICFVLWRSGDFNLLNLRFDVKVDPIIIIGFSTIWTLLGGYLGQTTQERIHYGPFDLQTVILGVIAISIGAVAQELLFRGYLQPRLTQLLGSHIGAWLTTSFLFGIWHLYQGPYGVVSAWVYGALLGALVLKTRRTLSVMLVHSITNSFLYVVATHYFNS